MNTEELDQNNNGDLIFNKNNNEEVGEHELLLDQEDETPYCKQTTTRSEFGMVSLKNGQQAIKKKKVKRKTLIDPISGIITNTLSSGQKKDNNKRKYISQSNNKRLSSGQNDELGGL